MRKISLLLVMSLMTIGIAFGQKKNSTEILYFKAQLACCKARACTVLQTDVDSIIIKYFSKKKIAFRVVMLADEANKAIVEKCNAQSQTVVLVKTRKKAETITDLTNIVNDYKINGDKSAFENAMKSKIETALNN